MFETQYPDLRLGQLLLSLFENGANYELVRASINILSDEELKAIYEAVKAVKQ